MSQTAPLSLLERALSLTSAAHAEAAYSGLDDATTRFANNAITQNVRRRDATLSVRVAFDGRVGRASATDLSEGGLRDCVDRAEAAARASAPDPEYLPPPGPQEYPAVDGYDPQVARAAPEDRAAGVRAATEIAAARGLQAAGSFSTCASEQAIAASSGLRWVQRLSSTQFTITAMSADSSGWAQSLGHRWEGVDPVRSAGAAVEKALAAREPGEVPPGEYTVVLEPAAVADFFGFFSYTMDARAAHEGRSAFTGREGTRVGRPEIHLSTRPDHPAVPCLSAAEDGLPLPATSWIEGGVLLTLSYGRFWAQKTGRPFTGRPANLIIAGSDRSLEELIGTVERGILVTRFWYIRFVDPMKLLLTGMTRDGLYWIEEGRVRHGLKNMRFNESPLRCLERVTALGREERVGRFGAAFVPSMRVEGFRFTSGTAF